LDKDKSIINAQKGRSVSDKDKNKSIINTEKGRGVFGHGQGQIEYFI
jgi:hypothetical protein